MTQTDSESPTEPTESKTTPGTEKMPDPSNCPRLSITADSSVTSWPSGLTYRHKTAMFVTMMSRVGKREHTLSTGATPTADDMSETSERSGKAEGSGSILNANVII
jgi:hypothetical protein